MAKRRPSGDGMVRKRDDGRWEGRIVVGHKENGDSIFRYIYADTQKELTAKLRQNIDAYQGIDLTEQSQMALSEWLDQWLSQMSVTLRPNTLERYRQDMNTSGCIAGNTGSQSKGHGGLYLLSDYDTGWRGQSCGCRILLQYQHCRRWRESADLRPLRRLSGAKPAPV